MFAPLPSVPWQEDVEDMELDMSSEVPYNFSQLSWDREMPLVEAQQILEKKMYPFKRVSVAMLLLRCPFRWYHCLPKSV